MIAGIHQEVHGLVRSCDFDKMLFKLEIQIKPTKLLPKAARLTLFMDLRQGPEKGPLSCLSKQSFQLERVSALISEV